MNMYEDQPADLIDLLTQVIENQTRQETQINILFEKVQALEARVQASPGLIEANQLKTLAGQVEALIMKKIKRRRIA